MSGVNALIIFAKAPDACAKTRLSSLLSDGERVALYEGMLRDTIGKLTAVDEADLCIFYTPPVARDYFTQFRVRLWPQSGGHLGQRMHAALDCVFRRSYKKAVLVGVDIPGLTPSIVRNALCLLDDYDAVFGPATDGGYYLVGLQHSCPELFEDIHWSSRVTLSETLTRAQRLGVRFALTEELSDVDTAEDALRAGLLHGNITDSF